MNSPNGGWSSEMLKQIDKEVPRIEPDRSQINYDPAPSAEQVAQERLSALLADITTTTLDQLRELRDEIDSLMQAIRNRDELINKAFKEHVAYARNAIKCKEIVQGSLAKIKHDFNNGMHPIPQTVTVQENKQ